MAGTLPCCFCLLALLKPGTMEEICGFREVVIRAARAVLRLRLRPLFDTTTSNFSSPTCLRYAE